MKFWFCALFALLWASFASACPDRTLPAVATYEVRADDLLAGAEYQVVAGGAFYSADCDRLFLLGEAPAAFYGGPPDFLFQVTGLRGHQLQVEVAGTCDTLLLINDAADHYFYDDDDAGALQPRIVFTLPRDGHYHVWVGTYDAELCDAVLRIQTFLN